jgi:phosphate transport system protein
MKKRIEEQCLRVIIRQQPIATDLRIVSSILKIVTDIERVGNHAGDIGELILRIQMKPLSDYSVHLEGMITAALELYANAINAYIKDDQAASHQVIRDDDIVDELFNKVKADIIAGLREESTNADEYIDMMMLAKYLEKIGDHAVNVAKWQIFKGEGEMV